jgi:uncharacterized phage-associated protein
MLDLRKYHYFDYEKIVQLLGYIQRKVDSTNKLTLIKLLFFADRVHLRRYFSSISHDEYHVLKNGPMATKTLNVLDRHSKYLESDISEKNKIFISKIQILDSTERKIKEVETDCLSKAEMNVVDMVADLFGSFSLSSLIDITHDYPECKRWEELFKRDLTDGELIVSDDYFKNPAIQDSPALQKYFNGVDPLYEEEGYLNEAKEFYNTCEGLKNTYM